MDAGGLTAAVDHVHAAVDGDAMSRRLGWLVVLVVMAALAGCGDPDAAGSTVDSADASVPSAVTTAPTWLLPTLGVLSVSGGCAQVRLGDGEMWADSCLQASVTRPRAAVSETIDGVELALIRVSPEVEMVAADSSVRFDQADGWVLVESPTPDFTMTFRGVGTAEAICVYHPLFIDCEVVAGSGTS